MADKNILSQSFQDSIVKLMIVDTQFIKIVRTVIDEGHFNSEYSRNLFIICRNFFDFHNEAPQDHFSDELKRFFDSNKNFNKEKKKIYVEYATKLQKGHPPNAGYVKRRLNEFVVTKSLEIGTLEAAELLEDGKPAEAKDRLYQALKSGIETENTGQFYHDEQDLERRLEQDDLDFLMPLGIPELDRVIGGLYRNRLTMVLGLYGMGKSWFLTYLAKQAIKRGLNVLHISHEMGEDELKIRYDMSFGALTKKSIRRLEVRRYDKETGEFYDKIIKRPSVTNYKAVKRIREMISRMPGKLVIKKYPNSSATMLDVRNLLDQLESFENFTPDLILNDYPEIMADAADFEQIGMNYRQHKRIADERGVAVVVPSQLNDERASQTCRVRLSNISNNKQKAGHVDSVIAFGQTEPMREAHQIFIEVLKSRNSAVVGARCIVGTNFDIGQFKAYSIPYTNPRDLLAFDGDDDE